MTDNKKIKHELADMLFDVREKLTDAEYKTLIETVTNIKEQHVSTISTLPAIQSAPTALFTQNAGLPEQITLAEQITLEEQLNRAFKKQCTYPDCNLQTFAWSQYCEKHADSSYKKTTDIKCAYKNTKGTQCLVNSKVGSTYCTYHIKNHTPKPPKVINTGTEKCEYMIKSKVKSDTGPGKRCKKYALLEKKYCSIHVNKIDDAKDDSKDDNNKDIDIEL